MTTKEEVKNLWKLCFDDSDEFINLYFERRYKDEINIAIRRDGKVVSALQMIPYPMTLGKLEMETTYVSGACTHPDYRRQGMMRQLLADAHRQMYENGACLSVLVSAERNLFGYCSSLGYEPSFYYAKQTFCFNDLYPSLLFSVADETDTSMCIPEHHRYLASRMKEYPCCVQYRRDDFKMIMNDLKLRKGKLLVARRGGLVHGVAFCFKENNGLVVKELFADNPVVKDSLLAKAMQMFQVEDAECCGPSTTDSLCLGMARVVCAEKIMALVARKYPSRQTYICVKDDEIIPENNGYYTLAHGRCTRQYLHDKEYQVCSINELVRLLLHGEHAYMSLMLN
jgi:predicted acetyltransferase